MMSNANYFAIILPSINSLAILLQFSCNSLAILLPTTISFAIRLPIRLPIRLQFILFGAYLIIQSHFST